MSSISGGSGSGGGGMGTVTSISQGNGITLTPNPITTTGTVAISGIVPTTFDSDSGAATTTTNTINLVGGSGITTSGSGDTITISASGGGGGITTIDVDNSGSVTGSTVSLFANTSGANAGSSIEFIAASSTQINLQVTDSNHNTIFGKSAGNSGISGLENCGFGENALSGLSTGSFNTAMGLQSGISINSGSNNTAFGFKALNQIDVGNNNTALGYLALQNNAGSGNTIIGANAGSGYVATEINNIILGPSAGTTSTNGEMWLGDFSHTTTTYIAGVYGTTVSSPQMVTIDSAGQLGSTAGSSGIVSILGNSGSITGSTVLLETLNATPIFSGSGTTMTLDFGATTNLLLGSTGIDISSGVDNVGVGFDALEVIATGDRNTSIGYASGLSLTSGNQNCLLGSNAGNNLVSGSNNIIAGYLAGSNYTGAESSNILLNSDGVLGESFTCRIGQATGTATGDLQATYIQGIYGVSPASPQMVIIDSAGQLGSQAIPGGSGIITIDGDTGSVTGSTISITGLTTAGSTVSFAGSGTAMTFNTTDANANIMIGIGAGAALNSSNNNTAIGWHTCNAMFNSQYNVALGSQALLDYTSNGNGGNTALGYGALYPLINGAYNIGIGYNTGSNYTGAESSNILIGASVGGINGESNALHIGAGTGTGNGQLNQAFIAGIQGITVTGAAVLVSTSDQLGIAVSSRRFKDNIVDMPSITDDLMKLRPVNFNYIVGNDNSLQSGLIAEEVHEAIPSLVVYDKEGLPQTVKYHDLPVLLLKEIQELRREINDLKIRR